MSKPKNKQPKAEQPTVTEQPQSPKSVVITVVMTQSADGFVPSHSVLVDGQPVEAQLGLILVGDVHLAVTSGVQDTTHMRQMASQASGLASRMTDLVFGTMLEVLTQHSHQEAATEGEPEPSILPSGEEALAA